MGTPVLCCVVLCKDCYREPLLQAKAQLCGGTMLLEEGSRRFTSTTVTEMATFGHLSARRCCLCCASC